MFTGIIVVCSSKSMCIPSFILIGCCVSEFHGYLCPYHNAWPEAVYCSFTMNYKVSSELSVSTTSQSFVCLHLQIAKCIS